MQRGSSVSAESNHRTGPNSYQTLMLILVGLLVFLMASRTPADPDMWWHLRAGEETIQAGKPLTVDTMTFTHLGDKWVNHSWLAEVVIYIFYDLGSYLGLSLYLALIATATMVILYRSLDGGALLRAAVIVLACLVLSPIWSPRPQQFSLLFFVYLNAWLLLFMQHKKVPAWPLPLLFILWANLHGGYSFGFMLLGVSIAGMMFDRVFRPQSESTMSWREIGRLCYWTAISLLAVLINPNGISTWEIPFQTVGVEVTKYIQEWESLDFHQISNLPYLVLLFGCFITMGLSGKKATGVELAGLTLFGVLSLTAQRMVGIFALFAAVVLARHLQGSMDSLAFQVKATELGRRFVNWRELTKSKPVSPGLRKTVNLTLAVILLLAGLIKLVYASHPIMVDKAVRAYYPIGAVDTLEKIQEKGNLLSDYGWGGYLDWRLRDNLVYFDGRADLYSDEEFFEWLDLIAAKPGWEAKLEGFQVKFILLPPEMELVEQAEMAGWQVLFRDDLSVLLRKPSG